MCCAIHSLAFTGDIFHPEERQYYNIERLWMDGTNQVPFVQMED